ncbi:MAG: hypothetical protein JOY64_22795 [Alphaproteobacteria bacterium]|nr:hypothetical protein [Alphaproteobacteria bacterium]MBV8410473.1 hypothetical protein [Alphaproteobacteria bacterium]
MSQFARFLSMLVLVLAAPTAQAQNKVPSDHVLEALVKSSLLSLNDANVTGDYSVLHAKLSKPFREQFSPDRLKETFREFAGKHVDYDIIAAYAPVYSKPAAVDDEGKLLVEGYFPTTPNRLKFKLDFIPSDGEWKLIGIKVDIDSP